MIFTCWANWKEKTSWDSHSFSCNTIYGIQLESHNVSPNEIKKSDAEEKNEQRKKTVCKNWISVSMACNSLVDLLYIYVLSTKPKHKSSLFLVLTLFDCRIFVFAYHSDKIVFILKPQHAHKKAPPKYFNNDNNKRKKRHQKYLRTQRMTTQRDKWLRAEKRTLQLQMNFFCFRQTKKPTIQLLCSWSFSVSKYILLKLKCSMDWVMKHCVVLSQR